MGLIRSHARRTSVLWTFTNLSANFEELRVFSSDTSAVRSVGGGGLLLTRRVDDDSGALVGFVEEAVGDGFGGGAGYVELAHQGVEAVF